MTRTALTEYYDVNETGTLPAGRTVFVGGGVQPSHENRVLDLLAVRPGSR
jgi:hypothetical protein